MSNHRPGAPGQEQTATVAPARGAGFLDVLADGEFRALWLAHLFSLAGDQISRVALSVLVYERTGSTTVTALSYAMSYLPWIIGGPLLSGLADRWPRRTVMLVADLLRAGLVLGAALSSAASVPLAVPLGLIFLSAFCTPPFSAARAALIPTILIGDRYVVASALGGITQQAAQVLGFAGGGALVAAVGSRPGMALNAASFIASAALIRYGVRPRPSALASSRAGRPGPGATWRSDLMAGSRLIVTDPFLRTLVLLALLATFLVVPEGLAAPVAAATGGGPAAVGLLLAAMPCGTVVGGLLVARLVPADRRRGWIAPLAIVAGLPLIVGLTQPGLAVTALCWTLCGLLTAYQLPANTAFAVAVPDRHRGQAMGVVQTGLAVGQGLGLLGAGILADRFGPTTVIAGSGLVATGLAVLIVLTGPRLAP